MLGLERIGIDDNFFELGGDSIMSIQLVSRARKAGLVITPRAVFQHQTVAGLAAVATPVRETVRHLPDIAIGALPSTPIMRWLQERGGPIERFNQAMLLRVPAGLQHDHLIAALQSLLDHHDALRLRLTASARTGEWGLEVAPPGAVMAADCLRRIDVCGLDDAMRARLHQRTSASRREPTCSGSRRDGAGGVVRCWCGAAGRLLLTIHHLAVDGVSWRILMPDLAAAWEAIARADVPALPTARDFVACVGRNGLSTHAQDPGLVGELALWTGMLSEPAAFTG